jgi:MSHA biogenesis protein MshJ
MRASQMVRSLKKRADRAGEWLAGRTPRERVMVFAGAFIVIALIWQMTLFSAQTAALADQNARQRAISSEISQLETSAATLEQQIAELQAPDEAVRAEIETLREDIADLTGNNDNQALDFIATLPVAAALRRFESTLEGSDGLTIIRFDRQMGSEPSPPDSSGEPGAGVDHRQMRLVFEATFEQTVSLLSRLEALSVPLVWRLLDYEVSDHPTARVTVRFDLYALGGTNQ